jgi:hypothetical protein
VQQQLKDQQCQQVPASAAGQCDFYFSSCQKTAGRHQAPGTQAAAADFRQDSAVHCALASAAGLVGCCNLISMLLLLIRRHVQQPACQHSGHAGPSLFARGAAAATGAAPQSSAVLAAAQGWLSACRDEACWCGKPGTCKERGILVQGTVCQLAGHQALAGKGHPSAGLSCQLAGN